MNGRHSYEIAKIISGVTQGTVLGPVLFILFIKDIKLCVKKLTSAFFADDNRIMKEISCVNDTAMLQHDLNDVIHWSLQNNMLLHEDKFDLITHRANPLSTLYELPHILHPVALHCIQLTQLKIWELSLLLIYLGVPTSVQ